MGAQVSHDGRCLGLQHRRANQAYLSETTGPAPQRLDRFGRQLVAGDPLQKG